MRTIWILALLTACGTTADDKTTDTDTDVTETDTDVTDTDTNTDCTGDVTPTGAQLHGEVTDNLGNPLGRSEVRVQFCRGVACITPECVMDGTFMFGGLDAGPGSFEIVPLGDDTRATPFVPVDLATDEDLTIDVTVPLLGAPVTIPSVAAPLEVAPGLFITLAEGDIEAPSPLDPAPTTLAGVNATDVALPVVGVEGTLVAMYYLAPFDYPAADGASVTVAFDNTTWAYADGDVELWVSDYFTASWEKVGDLTVDGDQLVTTGTLPRISTIIVVETPED